MIAGKYLELRSELETALAGLLKLGSEVRRPTASLDSIQGLLAYIREPLLVVVVGEPKSGKSSLIDALFGENLAKPDSLPATQPARIYRHGLEDKSVQVSPHVTERHLPLGFLRDFILVEIGGLDWKSPEFRSVAQEFLPSADVVLFVFSVMNPWTISPWELLNLSEQEWLKNLVFVLPQADLRAPAEIDLIRRNLQDTATQKLGFAPPIFAVSARDMLRARNGARDKDRLWKESEFRPLEEQINLVVMQAGGRILKLRSACQLASVMLHEIGSEIRPATDLVRRNEARLTRLDLLLQSRKEQASRQISEALRTLPGACRDAIGGGLELFKRKFSFWFIGEIIAGETHWRRSLYAEIERKLRYLIAQQVEGTCRFLENDLRGLWPQLHDMVEQVCVDFEQRIPQAIPDFTGQRRDLFQTVELSIKEKVSATTMAGRMAQVFSGAALRLRIIAGITVAGAIAAAFATAAIAKFAGLLAVSSLVVGIVVAFVYRGKILRRSEKQMEAWGAELGQAIQEQLKNSTDLFYNEVARVFQPLNVCCANRKQGSEPALHRAEELQRNFAALAARLV